MYGMRKGNTATSLRRAVLAVGLALLALPAAAGAQATGSIDRLEPYESSQSELVFARVSASAQRTDCPGCSWVVGLFSLPAAKPCSSIAALTGPGSRGHAYMWSESGVGPLSIVKEDALLERSDGPQQRVCLLGPDDAVLAERVVDISAFATLTEREALGWLRHAITCDGAEECRTVRNLSMNCTRRSTSEFRCFARWRAKNRLTGVERVTWLHDHFRVVATLDDRAGVRRSGKTFNVGPGDGRPSVS